MDEMNGTIDSLKDAVDKEKQSSDKLVKKISATQVIIAISGLFIDLMKTISVNTEFICRNDWISYKFLERREHSYYNNSGT